MCERLSGTSCICANTCKVCHIGLVLQHGAVSGSPHDPATLQTRKLTIEGARRQYQAAGACSIMTASERLTSRVRLTPVMNRRPRACSGRAWQERRPDFCCNPFFIEGLPS
jgi:hypothetical protein